MLGDVIRKGRSLESQRIRVWKARCCVERARRSVIDLLLLPDARGDMAQMAVEMERETAQRELEEAEYRLLCEREGENALTRIRAEGRAATFALNVLLMVRKRLPEPMHPFLDVPMRWVFGDDGELHEEWDDDDIPMDGMDCYGSLDHE